MGIRQFVPSGLKQNVANALGWKANRKIVVIESDDWGSIRMPSRAIYNSAFEKGLLIDDHYNRYDSLETAKDLLSLFDVLSVYRDKNGNHPILTANFLMANPDFERIKAANFERYEFELLQDTYRKTPGCEESFRVIQQGMAAGLFRPQSHGREHLNVPLWMAALRDGHRDTLLAFDHGFWGHKSSYPAAKRGLYLAACDYNTCAEAKEVKQLAVDGLSLFEQIFGYQSETFIAPNFIWGSGIETALAESGVLAIQGQRNQLIPVIDAPHCRTLFHFTGQKNKNGQRYLVRNVLFEPASELSRDWVDTCLKDIGNAFACKTPAIISMHRVNFIGSLVPENRDRSLQLLKQLLNGIIRRWSNIEFMSSDHLGRQMRISNRYE